jgi:hypothetical protein
VLLETAPQIDGLPGPAFDAAGRALSRSGIYFKTGVPSEHTIRYFDFATGRMTDLRRDEGRFDRFWLAVSPDERWVLYSHILPATSELMLVENFR